MKGGERMKTGLIIYVVGNDTANFIDEANLQGQIPAWADIVEIVAQNNGHYDIHDAWWKLIARAGYATNHMQNCWNNRFEKDYINAKGVKVVRLIGPYSAYDYRNIFH